MKHTAVDTPAVSPPVARPPRPADGDAWRGFEACLTPESGPVDDADRAAQSDPEAVSEALAAAAAARAVTAWSQLGLVAGAVAGVAYLNGADAGQTISAALAAARPQWGLAQLTGRASAAPRGAPEDAAPRGAPEDATAREARAEPETRPSDHLLAEPSPGLRPDNWPPGDAPPLICEPRECAILTRLMAVQAWREVSAGAAQTLDTLSLQLTPAALGVVDLEVGLYDGALRIVVFAQTDAAVQQLAAHLGELRAALAQAGLSLDSFELRHGRRSDARGRPSNVCAAPARTRTSAPLEPLSLPVSSAVDVIA